MNLGEIYLWETDQALGHATRNKYHVYICESDGMADNTFLFISKSDYGGDYLIKKTDYPFLPLPESYVSCGRPVFYSDEQVSKVKKELKGQPTKPHMQELYKAVLDSDFMEGWLIKRVCNALRVTL